MDFGGDFGGDNWDDWDTGGSSSTGEESWENDWDYDTGDSTGDEDYWDIGGPGTTEGDYVPWDSSDTPEDYDADEWASWDWEGDEQGGSEGGFSDWTYWEEYDLEDLTDTVMSDIVGSATSPTGSDELDQSISQTFGDYPPLSEMSPDQLSSIMARDPAGDAQILSNMADFDVNPQTSWLENKFDFTGAGGFSTFGKIAGGLGALTGNPLLLAAASIGGMFGKWFGGDEKSERGTSSSGGSSASASQTINPQQTRALMELENFENQTIRGEPGAGETATSSAHYRADKKSKKDEEETDYETLHGSLPGVDGSEPADILGHLEETSGAYQSALSAIMKYLGRGSTYG